MSKSNQAMDALVEAMRAEYGASAEFEVELGGLVGRYRAKYQRALQERQAAQLLPLGADLVAVRQCCHRSTAYRRAKRAKIVATNLPSATNP